MSEATVPSPPMDSLAALLIEFSYKRGTFTLASGKQSDFYIDCKQTLLTPEGHCEVGWRCLRLIHKHFPECRAVAGVEIGGCPMASAVSMASWPCGGAAVERLPLECLYVRKKAKDHGTTKMVEGGKRLRPGAKVVLLEDVLTTGESSRNAILTLQDAGYAVIGCIALVDRMESGKPISVIATLRGDVPVLSVFTRETLLAEGGVQP